MGKSATTSCFKIITCSADPTDNNEDLASQPESKTSSDKRRWSFRKRSVRHQVPSTTVISGPQSVNYDKENSEVTSNKFYTEKDLCIPEKIPKVEWMNETPPLPSAVISSEVTNSLVEDKTAATFDSNTQEVVLVIQTAATFDSNIQESDVLVIQTAIRRYLAQRELCKLKNVVKLQAAVRGHLVRREAVGTLRCVQAIVKMQALVRAHHARQTVKRFLAQEKLPEKSQINLQWSTVLVKRDSDMKANTTNSSTEKLLSNGFARQLLESIPKTKPIRISCDPSKPDSAWKWLERWMAVTSSKIEQTQELSLNHIHLEVEENNNLAACKEDVAPTIDVPLSSNRDLLPTEVTFKTASEDDFVTDTAGKIEFQDLETVADSLQNEDHNQFQGAALGMKQEHFGEGRAEEISDSVSCQLPFLSDETSHSIDYKNSNEPESVPEILISTSKREACQSIESEGKKSEPGMRKVRNPAFAAVQAKFEELSSAPKVSKSASSVESILVHAQVESLPKTEEHSLTESSATKTSVVQVAASECGTEISISSTLDSPERSEADGGEIVLEIGTSKEGNCDVNKCEDDVSNPERAIAGTKNSCSDFMTFQQQGLDENDGDATNVIRSANSVLGEQQPTKEPTSDIQIQPENMNDCRSPEASPRSHMTVPDSHGTPSSQISVHTNTSKTEKHSTTSKTVNNITGKKQRYKVVAKSSPPSLKNDSGERHNSDHLPKDVKNAKMRNSFGMAKHSHLDHEPRINSGNSLPSYMQATESARAKVHGTISLKSSPDVQDKDNYTKKRHSLPIGDDNQSSSPRVQRSASQTQQKSKGNSNHSPQTSVERRWQR